jgi:hypothetical protein
MPTVVPDRLEPDDLRALWRQFAEVHADAQKSFDSTARTLAAGGVAITVSIGTALDGLTRSGVTAAIVFLGSLAVNFLSYASVQFDMNGRLKDIRADRQERLAGNHWTNVTRALNAVVALGLLAGGAFLAYFVATSA